MIVRDLKIKNVVYWNALLILTVLFWVGFSKVTTAPDLNEEERGTDTFLIGNHYIEDHNALEL